MSRFSDYCAYLVLTLVNVSYCPGVILTSNYKIIVGVIVMIMVIALILNIFKHLSFAISLYLFYGLFALLVSSITYLFTSEFIFSCTSNIFLSITCFLFGYCNPNNTDNFIYRCMKIYILSALFMGLYSVLQNSGFAISGQYAFAVKNSSGVLLGTAIILNLFILNREKKRILFWGWFIVLLLLSISLLTFRCRTVILSVSVLLLYFIIRKKLLYRIFSKEAFIIILVLFSVASILDINLLDYIYDSLFANKDINSVDSITSGRLNTYQIGLSVFQESPLLGNVLLDRNLPPIDNFIIGHMSFYGIIGLGLVLPAYLFVWYVLLRGLYRNSIDESYPFMLLFIICMSSFTEGPYPFGPGTPVICAWFMLGWWYKTHMLNKSKIEK